MRLISVAFAYSGIFYCLDLFVLSKRFSAVSKHTDQETNPVRMLCDVAFTPPQYVRSEAAGRKKYNIYEHETVACNWEYTYFKFF